MITRAFVQVQNRNRPIVEAKALLAVLPSRGIPVEPYSLKQMQRGKVPLARDILIAGDMDAVPWALKRMGVVASLPCYPSSLFPYLGRQIRTSTVDRVRQRVELEGRPLFVKPKSKHKRFTGFVYESLADEMNFFGASRRLDVWVSEVVTFVAEFRIYVARGRVVGMARYRGDSDTEPRRGWLEELISALASSNELVAGFGLDVGRLDSGAWAVVECNEGYGLGLYPGLPEEAYAEMILARWEELMEPLEHDGNVQP